MKPLEPSKQFVVEGFEESLKVLINNTLEEGKAAAMTAIGGTDNNCDMTTVGAAGLGVCGVLLGVDLVRCREEVKAALIKLMAIMASKDLKWVEQGLSIAEIEAQLAQEVETTLSQAKLERAELEKQFENLAEDVTADVKSSGDDEVEYRIVD